MSFLKGIKQVDMIKCGLQYKRIALKAIFLLLIFNFQFSIFNFQLFRPRAKDYAGMYSAGVGVELFY